MQKLLNGKTAIVTGGTAGIGKAVALLFVEQGADVAIFGTNQARAEQTIRELEQAKTHPEQKIRLFLLDVSKMKAVEGASAKLLQEWGQIDILVNNAGITRDSLLMRMNEEDWDRVIEVNLKSVYNTCRFLCRPMMKSRSGSIINITSVIGLMGNAGQVNYAASKSGMIGFTKSLAKELASRGVRANCIAPGYIETQMTDALTPQVKEQILTRIPLNRIGQPRDIAHAVLYLASDLSNYVTGQVIAVDGGMVM
ncbi:MAG TPA: 3-oxoacyl-ACP reductase FabG [Chlamydiales bacterium]|nr:3-oxoacyl-ACP reductase FabG [Chlamydiales bacterium]